MDINELKSLVLSLDADYSIKAEVFKGIQAKVKQHMGDDASLILFNAIEKDTFGDYYFPDAGDGLKTWKRMLQVHRNSRKLNAV